MDPKTFPTNDLNNTDNQPEIIRPDNTSTPTLINPSQPIEQSAPQVVPALEPQVTRPIVTSAEPQTQPQIVAPENPAIATVATASPVMSPAVKKGIPKLAIFGVASVALLAIGGAAFYFGYYTNSSFVYKQSLAKSGKGFTELTNQFLAADMTKYKGYTGTGTYQVASEGFKTDGKVAFKSDKSNSEMTFDVGIGVSRLDFTVRSLKSVSTNPDLYIKVNGLNGLGEMLGPEYGALTSKYNDKWIVVDHTLLDNAQSQIAGTKESAAPTSDQIIDEVNAFTKVNEVYVFSTDPETSVTTVLETYGKKSIDGHDVIHYKVGYNKSNVKKYITAQHSALKNSKLNDWIKANDYTKQVDEAHTDLLKSADKIKATDSFDLYADIKNRVIYKVRLSETKNPAANYIEVGLDHNGKDEIPFFLAGKSEDQKTDFRMNIKADTKTNVIAVDFKITGDMATKSSASGEFKFKPTNESILIAKPESAKQIAELFSELGLGDPFGAVSTVGETLGVSTSIKKP